MVYSPSAIANPALRAELNPPFSLLISFMRESFAAYSSQITGQLSGEPSLTRINS